MLPSHDETWSLVLVHVDKFEIGALDRLSLPQLHRGEIARLNQELQERGTQVSQLQADLSKLQVELAERIHDGDRIAM
jgi:hypothetical protein